MKKIFALILLIVALLTGCVPQSSSDLNTDSAEICDESSKDAIDSDDTNNYESKIAYYEHLVNELQQELLSLRTELYVSRVEYESKLAELKKEPDETDSPENETTPSESHAFTYMQQDGAVTITAYNGNEKNVIVPHTIAGLPVKVIADRAFASNTNITSVTLPYGIEGIGWFAFSGCISLTEIAIPTSVSTIGYGALENCKSDLTVKCTEGSYAQQYARSYGLATDS